MCDELAEAHKMLRATRNHELIQLSSSSNKLPMCILHNKPFAIFDRTCQRMLCGEICQNMDEHSRCETVTLMREKEERVDKELKALCDQLDVDATLKLLQTHEVTSNRLLKEVEQDKAFVLGQLEANYNKVRLTLFHEPV
jgi:hypothetical protein